DPSTAIHHPGNHHIGAGCEGICVWRDGLCRGLGREKTSELSGALGCLFSGVPGGIGGCRLSRAWTARRDPHPSSPCRGRNRRSCGKCPRKSLCAVPPPSWGDYRDDPMIHQRFRAVLAGMAVTLLLGCGSSGGSNSPGPNVLSITINPASAAICKFANDPCTQVTICQLGTSICQTISDVLVDTGSSGLRIFSSALTLTLPSSPIGECLYFGSGTDWGAVHTVDVILGKEPAVSVPIQVVDPTFAGQYTSTGQPASNICGVAAVDASP